MKNIPRHRFADAHFMRLALRLARRGCGTTSRNPMLGSVLVKGGEVIGRGCHRRAGLQSADCSFSFPE
jgi:diaminohydroxyphosphoribosylaminopyrimidine deaminase/5-amino-6-(5-phosphoribosylamino)uracil reductase